MQSQLARFQDRGVSVVALSVDPVKESRSPVRRLKLSLDIVSDQDYKIMQAYKVQNPNTEELALHAVFIVDQKRQIYYRKVAGRRPKSQELLDAIDYQAGRYPLGDKKLDRVDLEVAYPTNIFQTIIELSKNSDLTKGMSGEEFAETILLLRRGESDETIVALRQTFGRMRGAYSQNDLLESAVWITNKALGSEDEMLETGRALRSILQRTRELRLQTGSYSDEFQVNQKQLDEIRTKIRVNAVAWNLDYAKSMLRGFRELAIAATQK